MVFRIVCGIMLIVFTASIVVQYNDPDPGLWIFLYGVPLILTGFAAAGRVTAWSGAVGLLYFGGFAYLMPKEFGPWLEMEEAREAFGLLICAVWLVALMVRARRRQVPDTAPPPEAAD